MSRKLACDVFGESARILDTLNSDSLGSLAVGLREIA